MKSIYQPVLLILCCLALSGLANAEFTTPQVAGDPRDTVFYAGGEGSQLFWCAMQLSDGSILIGGGAEKFDWVPKGTPATMLKGNTPTSGPTGMIPFLLHTTSDLSKIQRVIGLPRDSAAEIRFIKSTNIPGQATGDLYISGQVKPVEGEKKDKGGYFVARLNGNFVDRPPTEVVWSHKVKATGRLVEKQPWDVDADGRVIFATGEPYSYNWMAINALTPDGKLAVVENWPRHWYKTLEGQGGEWTGSASDCPGTPTHSGIVLKTWGRGDFRSHTKEDFLLKTSDGNGGMKQGRWPLDAMFDGYFDPETKKTAPVTGTKKGYYGYRFGGTPCANVGAIAIDRRTGAMYIGGNNKSKLPGGNPDFEPWVVKMDSGGALEWWQRLYSEEKGVSTPDQYVDALAIDYRGTPESGALVVVARAHGNNVNNFWNGDAIQHPENPGRGFQNGFTGTHGNMHFSWLGRMTLNAGEMLHASYLAEYAEGAKHQDKPFAEPMLDHWPHFRAGWPDLNTTRVKPSISVDARGRIYLAAIGRRVITTKNAYMQMPSPLVDKGAIGAWSHFARVYSSDLTSPEYSSLVTSKWDWSTGQGGGGVTLESVIPLEGGLLAVGYSALDKKSGQAKGNAMPLRNVPGWGSETRQAQMAVAALLHLD